MININFEGKPDLWELLDFTIEHNIDIYDLCHAALIKKALFSEENKLLLFFRESMKSESSLFSSEKSASLIKAA